MCGVSGRPSQPQNLKLCGTSFTGSREVYVQLGSLCVRRGRERERRRDSRETRSTEVLVYVRLLILVCGVSEGLCRIQQKEETIQSMKFSICSSVIRQVDLGLSPFSFCSRQAVSFCFQVYGHPSLKEILSRALSHI